jgi:hypothetical protein
LKEVVEVVRLSVRRRRAFVVVSAALGLAALILVLAFSGSFQSTTSRRLIEKIQRRRVMDLAAASALEEACARLEASLPAVPLAAPAGEEPAIRWPAAVEPLAARRLFGGDGLAVSPVAVKSSEWRTYRNERREGERLVVILGILELRLRITSQFLGVKQVYDRMVRRYAYADLDPSGRALRFRIQHANVASEVSEG